MIQTERIFYRIDGWNEHFETAKSRTINHKSWGAYPLKQGSGYCRMMTKKNGAAIYGAFIAMCSIVQQKPLETRHGYLTDTGGIPGYSYDELDISAMTRITLSVIKEAIEELVIIRWLTPCDSTGKILEGYREDTARIPRVPYTERTDRTDITERTDAIIDFLNEKTGKAFKHSSASRKPIDARLKDFSVDDCKAVIEYKTAEWLNNPKMKQYLQPSTLFNGKFEERLVNATAWIKDGKPAFDVTGKNQGHKKLTNDRDISEYSHLVEGPES